MKTLKLIILSTLIILTIAGCSNAQAIQQTKQDNPIQQYKVLYNPLIENYINNVGNNQEYLYQITSITDNGEIHGKALNKVSSDNAGIFLYQSELSFNVQTGDKISVVWGQYEDEFKSIEKVN
ncbi:hypothetical protein [Metabacillus sp. Hm71]|uniref:hypothetical protein n=1 Tax=Metabacillus sp. Hm71 TaxID=3450743 RepID=UPI003F42F86D